MRVPADERVPESSGGFEALHAPCSLALEHPCPSWCGQYLCNALLQRMTWQCAYLGLQVAFKSWCTAGHLVQTSSCLDSYLTSHHITAGLQRTSWVSSLHQSKLTYADCPQNLITFGVT